LRFCFGFGFFGVFIVCAGSCAKAEIPTETRHDWQIFLKPSRAVLYKSRKRVTICGVEQPV